MKKQVEGIVKVYGKRWFQKSYGNTYHTVQVMVNDEILKSSITYGYENQYKTTAYELLLENGYDIPNTYEKFVNSPFVECNAIDVNRKKDL